MEIEVLDLKRSNQTMRDERKRIDNDIAELRREVEDEREKSKNLQQ